MHIGQHQHTASFFLFLGQVFCTQLPFRKLKKKNHELFRETSQSLRTRPTGAGADAQSTSAHFSVHLQGAANDIRCLVGGTGSYHSYQRLLSGTTLIRMRSGDLIISIKNQVLVLICSFLLYF
jgi:hypothetical protein